MALSAFSGRKSRLLLVLFDLFHHRVELLLALCDLERMASMPGYGSLLFFFLFSLSVPFSLVLYLLLVIPDYDHLYSRSVFVNNFTYSILLSLHQTGVLIAKIYGIPHKWTINKF